ncbi:hypothetical protein PHAVU_010G055100 [Phaseolus vulgaris]|uniref:TIR domain-containing protein n=1 Tax=Phaseolus vulgaris TaxID=3885 RepID=V7ALY1_PHAVU|nr:hypothetical protein PHAVU_010G055100g [Phaseolus vulgaris]ESW06524.1 hypothetical protein PHAVU_010G055100g [Phaseolus vulgaris]
MPSNAIIQYTSSSSSPATYIYDVFVSFRGEDTRNTFTSFLFQALRTKGINVVIIPIFYDVEPSVVRKQSGCYEKAFTEYEKRLREDEVKMEEVQRWRQALTQVANISGWDIRNKSQCEQIKEIVQKIIKILGPKMSRLPKDELIAIESRVEELKNLLCLEPVNDVRVVGISGMHGIGKTTLARALYERIYHQYDFGCFIDDVSNIYRDSGSLGVQKQLISQSLNEKSLELCNVIDGTYWVWTKLHNARTLIVLDNVDQGEQLKLLTGNRDIRTCISGGSRIIIISRDEHILKTHEVNYVYQVHPLSWKNVVQLFCRNAFKVNYILDDYEELASEVLFHAQGHPLAIEVIGSSLSGRNVSQWKIALGRLKYNKDRNIMDVLRISFNQLEEEEKEIFLDIPCFLNSDHEGMGYSKDEAEKILSFRGFDYKNGIPTLIEKFLITCEYGYIHMHRLLMDLGQSIVREKSPKEPLKWSRLWEYEDFEKSMLDNEATENLEVIYIECNLLSGTVRADGSLNHLSNELAYLNWRKYPFKCLPQSFQPEKLVELRLVRSSIKRLWKGTKSLNNLRFVNLSYSEDLVEMPDVRETLNLEKIELEKCIKLRKVHPSIGLLRKLAFLNLRICKNLMSLPNIILSLNSLEYLNVSGFLLLPSIPTCPCSLTCLLELDLSFCNLVRIPDAIGKLRCLERLNLKGNNFTTLPNLQNLFRLYHLNLQHCKPFKRLPVLPSQTDLPSTLQLGLLIYDCPELVVSEDCSSRIFSWVIQIFQARCSRNTDSPNLCPSAGSVIPGSEIPRWFNNQFVSMDNSIRIDASPIMHVNNWIGVDITGNGSIKDNPRIPPVDLRRDLVIAKSDHMWLFYLSLQEFHRLCYNCRWYTTYKGVTTVKFSKLMANWTKIWKKENQYVKVYLNKYGYRWVYEQDRKLPNSGT